MRALVIGCGQLGSAVVDALHGDRTSPAAVTVATGLPWGEHAVAAARLADAVQAFVDVPAPGAVLWCAGAGVVGTDEASLAAERALLAVVLDRIGSGGPVQRLFLASSAGGVYAGNTSPCSESTRPVPVSDYGRSKLAQEDMVSAWSQATGVSVLIGRISNLYGPRQNDRKPQGFITHLLTAMQLQRPFVYTVPASTLRDFVYTDDVARRIASWIGSPPEPTSRRDIKILGAEHSVSLAHVAAIASRVTRRPARVLFTRRADSQQPAAVPVRSTHHVPGVPDGGNRSLELGVWQTWQALARARRLDR